MCLIVLRRRVERRDTQALRPRKVRLTKVEGAALLQPVKAPVRASYAKVSHSIRLLTYRLLLRLPVVSE